MSNNDNSLLNFLKTNSLFNQSPTKNSTRKSKSRSKDKSDSKNTPTKNRETYDEEYRKNKLFAPPTQISFNPPPETFKNYGQPQTNSNLLFTSNSNTNEPRFTNPTTNEPRFTNSNANEPRFTNPTTNEGRFNTNFDSFEQKRQNRNFGVSMQPQRFNQQWQGDTTHNSHANFQSARIESFQCLENLGLKVRNQIASLNSKVDSFNSKMYRTITNQFKSLRERVLFIFDEAFKESERYIREYMKNQEEILTGDLLKMREVLMAQSAKIEEMKAEIEKPQWRKMAGEIIASELERKIDEIVKHSSQLNVGRWELGDLVGYRLKDLEKDLRGIVRLKRDT